MTTFVIALLLFSATTGLFTVRAKPVCRMLTLEGGGTKGAYQAGAFMAMANFMDAEEVKYDVITGVSVGSLNGLLISSQAKGEEKSAAGKMKTVWDTIVQGDVFQSWPYVGVVPGLFGKQSLFDNSPLDAYLKKKFVELGGKVVRKISVGIVDAQTGNYINKNESVGNENMPHYIFASASVPAFFPHIIEGDLVLIDGGTTDNMNLRNGIARCREIVGDDDEAITIDVLMSNPFNHIYYNMKGSSTGNVYSRAKDLKSQRKARWFLNDTIRALPNINWRYLVSPKKDLPNYPYVPLSFDRKVLSLEYELGYADAKALIEAGRPNMVDTVRENVLDESQARLPIRRKIR